MLPENLHRELKLYAVSTDTTLQKCINMAIEMHLHAKCKTVKIHPDYRD
tara:strand:- start:654 stop:800 length:147 start_codon:yes stop_codon:yes gene_type:complete